MKLVYCTSMEQLKIKKIIYALSLSLYISIKLCTYFVNTLFSSTHLRVRRKYKKK